MPASSPTSTGFRALNGRMFGLPIATDHQPAHGLRQPPGLDGMQEVLPSLGETAPSIASALGERQTDGPRNFDVLWALLRICDSIPLTPGVLK